jgi:hypothetical protein
MPDKLDSERYLLSDALVGSKSDILDSYFDHTSFRLVSRSHEAIEA